MKPTAFLPLLLTLALASCKPPQTDSAADDPLSKLPAIPGETRPAPVDLKQSVVRINSTQQSWNPGQPWEKTPPRKRRALAAIVDQHFAVTTSELVADATYLEFESPDGTRFTQAKVVAIDYEANLALIGPVSEEEGAKFFEGTSPLTLIDPPSIGDTLEILQVEENGVPLLTSGLLQSIDVSSNFLPGHSFLTYSVKASMQSAASSYSLPVLKNNQLAGVLISYNSDEQLSVVASTDILSRFLKDATSDQTYTGFPSLGIATARTEDSSFRQWLKLPEDQGGLYINNVRKNSSAEAAGLQKGDVIVSIDGSAIDRRGYYSDPHYGSMFWGHLVRGSRAVGDQIKLSVLRGGEPLELTATLKREEERTRLVPNYTFGTAPNYLVKGGFIFQELTRPLLEAFGNDWAARAPLNLLDVYENPEKYEASADRIVFLSASIPTPATVGYERLRNLIVKKVNGKEIRNMKTLIEAFDSHPGDLQSIEFLDENFTIYLDDTLSGAVDEQLLQRGIPRLSRSE